MQPLKYKRINTNIFFIIFFVFLTACQAATTKNQIIPVFQKYKELNLQYMEAVKSNNTSQVVKRKEVEEYAYNEYTKALHILEKNYCSTPDKKVLNEFISVLLATQNSAYELPSFVLGEMFICQSDSIIETIKLNSAEKKYIVDTLDWGFRNAAYENEEAIKNYTELVDKLKHLKNETE